MGNTVKSGEHVEDVKTGDNVNKITTVNPEKILNKTNTQEKMKRGIRRERKGKEDVLKKYCQLNVQGLITSKQPQEKVEMLRDLMNEERPLFLALTETWLHEHKEAEVHIDDYTLYRKDRPLRREIGSRGRHVGGVALYIDSSWLPDSKEVLGYSNSVVDVLAIHSKKENVLIVVLYR